MHEKLYPILQKSFVALLFLIAGTGAARAQYCTNGLYTTGCSDDDYIQSVATTGGTTNISNLGTGCSNSSTAYTYYSSQTLTVAVGAVCSVEVTVGPYPETVFVWVDWNADGDFLDANEAALSGVLNANATGAGPLNIPPGTINGTKRMRVRTIYNTTTGITACSNHAYGEAEDYNVVVTGGVSPCSAPGNVSTSNVMATSATFNWLATPGALGYEYVLDNSPSAPTSGFQVATSTSVSLSNLTPNTTYYFHLRAACSTSVYSPWIDVSFTTAAASACAAPVSITVAPTNNAATLTWPGVTDATAYEHANTTSVTPPTSGSSTTSLTASYGGLAPNTVYYAHVRSSCGGSFSSWQTTLYTTAATSVADVSGAGVRISAQPNPASDQITVRVEGTTTAKGATLLLTDMAGRVVRSMPAGVSSEINFNLAGIPAGLYTLQYIGATGTGVIRVQKL